MRTLLPRILAIALCSAAGFAATRWWPAAETKDAPVARQAAAPVFKPAPWLALKGGARLAACLDYNVRVSAAEWPAHFAHYQNDELLRPALIEGWIAADPAGFWKWIVSQKDVSLLEETGDRLFTAWAKKDAEAAFAATAQIASACVRDPLRARVIETVLEKDLAAGLALAAKCGPLAFSGDRNEAWMRKDPAAAVRGLTALTGGEGSFRLKYLPNAVKLLAKENPVAFLEWLESKPRVEHYEIWDHYFTENPVADVPRAIAAAAGLAPGISRDRALMGSITAAAQTLPAAEVVKLAAQHLTGWERTAAVSNAAEKVAATDPVKAAELLAALPANRYLRFAAPGVAEGYAKADWNGAREWAQELPDSATRRVAWQSLSRTLPPERVQEFAAAAANMPLTELSDSLLRNVRQALEKQNPGTAAQWLNSLPADRADWARAVK